MEIKCKILKFIDQIKLNSSVKIAISQFLFVLSRFQPPHPLHCQLRYSSPRRQSFIKHHRLLHQCTIVALSSDNWLFYHPHDSKEIDLNNNMEVPLSMGVLQGFTVYFVKFLIFKVSKIFVSLFLPDKNQ